MALDDPQEAVKAAVLDRLTHPVMGVMVIALAVCNWKPVAFLVISDLPGADRIQAAEKYVTWDTALRFPLIITAIWVLLGPILKALALIYDRFVSDWEKARAYNAALNVVARNTTHANEARRQAEESLTQVRAELAEATAKTAAMQDELRKSTEGMETLAKVGSQGWQSLLIGGGRFPLQPGTEPYARAKTKFDQLEVFREQVLGSAK